MLLFSKLPHREADVDGHAAVLIECPVRNEEDVVGTSFNHEHLHSVAAGKIAPRKPFKVTAWLLREPDNADDPNAVAVHVLGGRAGYLQRYLAGSWSPLLAEVAERYGKPIACKAKIVGGFDLGRGDGKVSYYGVVLLLPWTHELAAER